LFYLFPLEIDALEDDPLLIFEDDPLLIFEDDLELELDLEIVEDPELFDEGLDTL
jgi:hypothetical protein